MAILLGLVKAKKSSLKKAAWGAYWFITVMLIRLLRGSLRSLGL
jgi:hypothetical protein